MTAPEQLDLPLRLQASPDVTVVHLPDGEVRLKPRRPLITGTVRDAARVLGLSPSQVRRIIAAGRIRAWRTGHGWLRVDMTSVYTLHADSEIEPDA